MIAMKEGGKPREEEEEEEEDTARSRSGALVMSKPRHLHQQQQHYHCVVSHTLTLKSQICSSDRKEETDCCHSLTGHTTTIQCSSEERNR